MAKTVLIEDKGVYSYPQHSSCYSPSVAYPEYLWDKATLTKDYNPIYDMVREAFHQMGYDKAHFYLKGSLMCA